MERWYRCVVCFDQLFKAENIVGTMGSKVVREGQTEYIRSPRFLIVNWTYGTKLRYSKRVCRENIRQYVTFCPSCQIYLNAPAQVCLGRTAAPANRHDFRHYKRSIQSFSGIYQVIRTLLVVGTPV